MDIKLKGKLVNIENASIQIYNVAKPVEAEILISHLELLEQIPHTQIGELLDLINLPKIELTKETKEKIRELLEKFAGRVQRYEEDGRIGEAENFQEFIDQALTQILEEVEKGMLSEEEIDEVAQNALEKSVTEDKTVYNEGQLFELLGRMKLVENIAHALYTAQKERTER